jgi:hypothetical protein
MTTETEKQKVNEVRFTASPQLWAYLEWLSKHTLLGKTPSDVAEQVLVQRLSDMRQEDFKADKI